MKTLLFSLILSIIFIACDTVETNPDNIKPMSVTKIEKITIDNKMVKITAIVTTPNPCWTYSRTDYSQLENSYTAKISAKPNGEGACPCVIWSFPHEETIYFSTKGEKHIKFWQNDSTYLDTTIVL